MSTRLRMPSMREDREALRRLAVGFLKSLRDERPTWKAEDLFEKLDLPRTALMLELAEKAGFRSRSDPTPEEVVLVAKLCLRGLWSDRVIADETGIELRRVRKVLELRRGAYGAAPYGRVAYGGNREYSDGKRAVPRRVTVVGQMSYRGCTYNLGAAYRGRMGLVMERGAKLVVSFSDRPTCTLALRP